MKRTVAIGIGHWYNPSERQHKENIDGEEVVFWEFKYNFEVGREIKRQLERHGLQTILNGPFDEFEDSDTEDIIEKWIALANENSGNPNGAKGALGGIPEANLDENENPHYNFEGKLVPKGFRTQLEDKINANEIDLAACVMVHFNGVESHTGKGFEVYRNTKPKGVTDYG